jgi:hypothetical protein
MVKKIVLIYAVGVFATFAWWAYDEYNCYETEGCLIDLFTAAGWALVWPVYWLLPYLEPYL